MTARAWLVVAVALVSATTMSLALIPTWAASASSACEQPPRVTAPNAQKQNRPVVLVHGWDGNGASMHPIGAYLTQRMHLRVQVFYFDYSSHNTDWAARPTVAGCLAAYITAISNSYKAVGGDGKVIVIAHSMGGLAIRFASSSKFVSDPVGPDLAGVITIDTPSLGSPFGDQALSRALEAVGGKHPTSLLHAPAGSDASICLAMHHPPANKLPPGCPLAPYLPAGIPIDQLAGDMSVDRTFFGVHLYTVDLGTDGPVPVQSAHGYVNSGPGGRAPIETEATDQPTVRCTVDFDQVAQLAAAQGVRKTGPAGFLSGIGDLLSPTIFSDARALDSLQSGRTSSELLGFLIAAYSVAPCSHSGMLTDPESLSDIGSSVAADLAAPGTPVIPAAGTGAAQTTSTSTTTTSSSAPAANGGLSLAATGTASDSGGDRAAFSISVGSPVPLSQVQNSTTQLCNDQISQVAGDPSRAVAVPVQISGTVTSSLSTDYGVNLGFAAVQSGNQIEPGPLPLLIAINYSNTGPECTGALEINQLIDWTSAASGAANTENLWIVVVNDITPNDPTDQNGVAHRLLLVPSFSLANQNADYNVDSSSPNAVMCTAASDPAVGQIPYIAVDKAVALQNGCTS